MNSFSTLINKVAAAIKQAVGVALTALGRAFELLQAAAMALYAIVKADFEVLWNKFHQSTQHIHQNKGSAADTAKFLYGAAIERARPQHWLPLVKQRWSDFRAQAETEWTAFAQDMLTVTDNLRRALDSFSEEARQAADSAVKPMLEGVELTERDLLKTLERHHIRKIDPQGERFDPNLHQAMFEVEDPALPAGTVTQVVQSGFVIGERLLRPALVGVSKGGPK